MAENGQLKEIALRYGDQENKQMCLATRVFISKQKGKNERFDA